jgi:hypothetical protein
MRKSNLVLRLGMVCTRCGSIVPSVLMANLATGNLLCDACKAPEVREAA